MRADLCAFLRIKKAFAKESTDEYAKEMLEFLQNNYKKQKGKIRDQRFIKVDGLSAAWLVFTLDSDDGSPTARLRPAA